MHPYLPRQVRSLDSVCVVPNIETSLGKNIERLEVPEEVVFTDALITEEQPVVLEKNYLPKPKKIYERGPAFHEKKEKNQKTNQGGSYKKKIKAKYKKPKTKGDKNFNKRNKK